ncbi:hypothetical protein NJT12_19710 [Flavobacterium sp. AC]|uniref:Uncharacterized protein n=1 Tax=Flavobacterium azizsancarii TaxID=2961580 RepID=A0ABT4WH78_9FLAO|nr:hypothetical protein [Flavobacterium azizsancarii]MDA6071855.1 hypothetical protein [Flavobacterium azizsancarii]
METNEIEKLENLKKIIEKYFNNPRSDRSEFYTPQIKINYYELGCMIINMLKMCVLTIDNEGHQLALRRVVLISVVRMSPDFALAILIITKKAPDFSEALS